MGKWTLVSVICTCKKNIRKGLSAEEKTMKTLALGLYTHVHLYIVLEKTKGKKIEARNRMGVGAAIMINKLYCQVVNIINIIIVIIISIISNIKQPLRIRQHKKPTKAKTKSPLPSPQKKTKKPKPKQNKTKKN